MLRERSRNAQRALSYAQTVLAELVRLAEPKGVMLVLFLVLRCLVAGS
jgi:hypothetical protein